LQPLSTWYQVEQIDCTLTRKEFSVPYLSTQYLVLKKSVFNRLHQTYLVLHHKKYYFTFGITHIFLQFQIVIVGYNHTEVFHSDAAIAWYKYLQYAKIKFYWANKCILVYAGNTSITTDRENTMVSLLLLYYIGI